MFAENKLSLSVTTGTQQCALAELVLQSHLKMDWKANIRAFSRSWEVQVKNRWGPFQRGSASLGYFSSWFSFPGNCVLYETGCPQQYVACMC